MKIGVSADIHLTTKLDHPERYNAFVNILDQCLELGIGNLILAGDVFDQSFQNYTEFEALLKDKKYAKLHIHIIPGNHDLDISNQRIVCSNTTIYSEPTWKEFEDGWSALFIPFMKNRSMGEVIQTTIKGENPERWFLVGHGDWSQGLRQINTYESGVYMPLTPKDIASFQPDIVFLGHMHIRHNIGELYYPGSPCGLDSTETNYRHFLVFDTQSSQVTPQRVITDVVYFNETFIVQPLDDEAAYLRKQIQDRIAGWNLDEDDYSNVKLRVKVIGYSTNRGEIPDIINQCFSNFEFVNEPDILAVSNANDPDRDYLMEKLMAELGQLDWSSSPDEPREEGILLEAMKLIYGEK